MAKVTSDGIFVENSVDGATACGLVGKLGLVGCWGVSIFEVSVKITETRNNS